MTWSALIVKNLLRRPVRTVLTAIGVGLGVGLIVALLAITNGVHNTASDLTHVGGADFGVYQSDVSDFTRSLLPESMAAKVKRIPGVSGVAKVKLLVVGGTLVFGLDPSEFAYRRLVVTDGVRAPVMAGDHSDRHVGDTVRLHGRSITIRGIYHSGDRFEDLGVVLPLRTVESLAARPGEITSIGVTVPPTGKPKLVAALIQHRFPGVSAITEPGQAIKVDTSSRLLLSTGWVVSILALIVGGIGVLNTMAMSVFERTREIGILRAVGWPVSRVAAMIVSEAMGICLIALAVGCALGVVAAQIFIGRSQLSGLISPSFDASTFLWGLAFALGVGLLGALYPTWHAVRLSPSEAFRRE